MCEKPKPIICSQCKLPVEPRLSRDNKVVARGHRRWVITRSRKYDERCPGSGEPPLKETDRRR